jgi:hypothetical protein
MKNIQYTNIRQILDEVHRHPLMRDVTLEQVVSYLVTFMGLFGFPDIYIDKEEKLEIKDYRTLLPCDCIEVIQVKDCKNNKCLRSMTDDFFTKEKEAHEGTFKIQGTVLYTSIGQGELLMSYKAIPLDSEGSPMLINNPVFLKTFELYIKKEVFTILFDLNKINSNVLQTIQQQYAWAAGELQSEFTIPDYNQMESIKNSWCTLLQRTTEFKRGFRDLGSMEYIKQQ